MNYFTWIKIYEKELKFKIYKNILTAH